MYVRWLSLSNQDIIGSEVPFPWGALKSQEFSLFPNSLFSTNSLKTRMDVEWVVWVVDLEMRANKTPWGGGGEGGSAVSPELLCS